MAKIDKAEAGKRLIVAAIKMVERGDEPLASHLVATSALNVLRDLITHRGQEYVTEIVKRGMFSLAEAQSKGLPLGFEVPEELAGVIEKLSEAIREGKVTKAEELTFEHEKPWEMLAYLLRPTNFVKHADRDPDATIDEEEVDPEDAIGQALAAYSMLRPDDQLPEETEEYLKRRGFI
ncbi:hypothetical protein [Qipengyuania gaetbuli]|uniref:hypothetical protein n=1 Tax=Qipengyuania gaetbuli TaxID=266952 RepID=UPI001CFE7EE1|nr:hypothetical protein [Qipengyuania gaetbuli]